MRYFFIIEILFYSKLGWVEGIINLVNYIHSLA